MADTFSPALGRTLSASAQSLVPSWIAAPVAEYAPAFRRRLAHLRASKAQRRAELRARTFCVIAADRKDGAA